MLHKGEFLRGTVNDLGRGGLLVANPAIPLQVAKPWRVDWKGIVPSGAPIFMLTEEVEESSKLHVALAGTVKGSVDEALGEKQRRVHALEQQVSSLKLKHQRQITLQPAAAAPPCS